ncbi:peptidase C2, calpain family [Kipferlia bialata]|uniref:Peptidase C2, calpain family n=1 Tax=Kipferlia bialata TaxID=797122 RepID=A0A9K3CTF6_9EUKA|nr:peptidase C2, calpain family [Kipferlia bialata]|eukprot:g4169.t1
MVIVDDSFPVVASGSRTMTLRVQDPNQWWSSIVEKALAKIAGSYQDLAAGAGFGLQPFSVFTGLGVYSHRSTDTEDLWKWISRLFDLGCLMAAQAVDAQEGRTGLVQGQTYPVLGCFLNEDMMVRLVKLRNTSDGDTWRGRWGANSDEWAIYDYVVEQTSHDADEEAKTGVFYMSIEDFARHFCGFTVCATGSWPPEGLEGVPSSLTVPVSPLCCYCDDHKKRKGLEGYDITTHVPVPMPCLRHGETETVLHGTDSPQYVFDVPTAMDVRMRVYKGEGEEVGMPWFNVYKVPRSATTYRDMRRLEGVIAISETDKPDGHVACSRYESWLEIRCNVGRYAVVVCASTHTGTPLTLEATTTIPLTFTPLPLGASISCNASTTGGGRGLMENPQYSFSVTIPQVHCVECHFPKGVYADGCAAGFYLVRQPQHSRVDDVTDLDAGAMSAEGNYNVARGSWMLDAGIYVICPWRHTSFEEDYIITVGVAGREDTLPKHIYALT